MIVSFPYIPTELVNIILEYHGRIKYKNGKYTNIIHKYDERYNVITPIIEKKKKIMSQLELGDNSSFYFAFAFDISNSVGLCYDYNFSYNNQFEICYYDIRNGLEQIRTYL